MHASHKARTLKGHVIGFNLSPKGVPEGVLLELDGEAGTVQVNLDPEVSGQVTAVVAEGQSLVAEAKPADVHDDAAHAVFDLVRLLAADGVEPLFVADGAAESDVTVRGRIVRLNHARRGEVNGGILDSGEFVHLRPHGVKAIGGLSVGQTLEVRGEVRPGWSGHRVIEAHSANGTEIVKPHPKGHKPKPHDAKRPAHH